MSDDLTADDLVQLLLEIRRLALSPHNRVRGIDNGEAGLLFVLGQIGGIVDMAIEKHRGRGANPG